MIHDFPIFVNLTNGLEHQIKAPEGYLRIQSTACEQKLWGKILQDLDYTFLMQLMIHRKAAIVDSGCAQKFSRAQWQGLPWIEYALNRRWFDRIETPWVKGLQVPMFHEVYETLLHTGRWEGNAYRLNRPVWEKIDYVGRLRIHDGPVRLTPLGRQAESDGDDNAHRLDLYVIGEKE